MGSLSEARVISTLIELKQILLSNTPKGSAVAIVDTYFFANVQQFLHQFDA
jgi:hypothetical protein